MTAVLITGMHRSGTSVVASLLQAAGVDLGHTFIPPAPSNPRGLFEDADFVHFHDRALATRDRPLMAHAPFSFQPTESEENEARALVAQRSDNPLWGWKDPRTVWFLEFWNGLIPEPRHIFVYRHPVDVLASLVRRHDLEIYDFPSVLTAWAVCNRAILDFYDTHADHCTLIDVYALDSCLERFGSVLKTKLGLVLDFSQEATRAVYNGEDLRRPSWHVDDGALADTDGDCMETLLALRKRADIAPLSNDDDRAQPHDGLSESSSNDQARRLSTLVQLLADLDPEPLVSFFGEAHRRLADADIARRWLTAETLRLDSLVAEREESLTALEQRLDVLDVKQRETSAALAEANTDLGTVKAEHTRLAAEKQQFVADSVELKQQLVVSRRDYNDLLSASEALRDRVLALQELARNTTERAEAAEQHVAILHGSRSFRLTRPLRGAGRLARELGGRAQVDGAEPSEPT